MPPRPRAAPHPSSCRAEPLAAGPAPARRRPGEEGFTLVEVLVAMLLLALVGVALVAFQSGQLAGAHRLSVAALARLEADNLAVDLLVGRTAPVEPVSGTRENGGRTLHWRVVPAPAPEARLPTFVLLRIEVAAAEDGPPLATRTVLRPS